MLYVGLVTVDYKGMKEYMKMWTIKSITMLLVGGRGANEEPQAFSLCCSFFPNRGKRSKKYGIFIYMFFLV